MTNSTTRKNIVLYADDDLDDLEIVQEAFRQYSRNVEVVTVRDGLQALSFLEDLSSYDPTPCLIILDINMPILNGKETLQKLRTMKRFESIPVVMFTTSSMPLDKTFAKQYKAGFITKPIDVKQMEIITDQFISHCTDEIQRNIRSTMGEK